MLQMSKSVGNEEKIQISNEKKRESRNLVLLLEFSRIYFGLRFLSDIIIGGFLGYMFGQIIVQLEEKYKFGGKIYKKIFNK